MGKSKGSKHYHKISATTTIVDDSTCPICQDVVGIETTSGVVEHWASLPCGHWFGAHCIKKWFGMTEKPVCPVCRHDMAHVCGHPVLPKVARKSRTGTYKEPNRRVSFMNKNTSVVAWRARSLQSPCKYCRKTLWCSASLACDRLRFRVFARCFLRKGVNRQRAEDVYWQQLRDTHLVSFARWWADQEPETEMPDLLFPDI